MIDVKELRRVLALHERTFALLRWVSGQLRSGTLDLSVIHTNMSFADAAEEWIRRNYQNLPEAVRPRSEEVVPFARLFASYLKTSFEIGKNKRRASGCGCYCDYCSYLVNAPYLKARSLSKKAHQTAMDLKRLYLQEIARDAGFDASQDLLQQFASPDMPLAKDLAMAAYAKELIRRTEFVTQGEGVYALWREFAWVQGHPDRKFKLTAEAIQRAQDNVIAALRAQSE